MIVNLVNRLPHSASMTLAGLPSLMLWQTMGCLCVIDLLARHCRRELRVLGFTPRVVLRKRLPGFCLGCWYPIILVQPRVSFGYSLSQVPGQTLAVGFWHLRTFFVAKVDYGCKTNDHPCIDDFRVGIVLLQPRKRLISLALTFLASHQRSGACANVYRTCHLTRCWFAEEACGFDAVAFKRLLSQYAVPTMVDRMMLGRIIDRTCIHSSIRCCHNIVGFLGCSHLLPCLLLPQSSKSRVPTTG